VWPDEDDKLTLVRDFSRYAPTKETQTSDAQEPQDWAPVARDLFWNVDRSLKTFTVRCSCLTIHPCLPARTP
jgi:hypothetical protein